MDLIANNQRRSPYQGLVPYREEDTEFFFGRERETRLVIANLFAAHLTLLYGVSGVGKSSVLEAGVVHELRQDDDVLLVSFRGWQDDPVAGLKNAIAEAALRETGERLGPAESLVDYLEGCCRQLNRQLMIILDQFEEYFLYHENEDGSGTFAVEFPRAVNRPNLPVSFLISVREDGLSKLDRFKGRIPGLFDNYLRLEHLGEVAARAAIEGPIARYNRLGATAGQTITIEPELVEAVLGQVRTGEVVLGEAGSGGASARSVAIATETRIETPFLQLVMERLWAEEMASASRGLRLATLNRLGGAERIVRTHWTMLWAGFRRRSSGSRPRCFNTWLLLRAARSPFRWLTWPDLLDSRNRT